MGLRAAFELVSPMDKQMNGAQWSTEWSKRRHLLRREQEDQQFAEHPLQFEHESSPEVLYEKLPQKVKNFVEGLEACNKMWNPRAKFTLAVKTYAEWSDYQAARARRVAQAKYEHEQEYATEYGTEWLKMMKAADKAMKV